MKLHLVRKSWKKRNFNKSEKEAADTFLGKSFFKPGEDSFFFLFSVLNISIIRRYFYSTELEIARERKETQRKKCFQHF